jgi:hypothetical protein
VLGAGAAKDSLSNISAASASPDILASDLGMSTGQHPSWVPSYSSQDDPDAPMMAKGGGGVGGLRNPAAASETGLGLPMTKVYCDFFGGSLAFRSLDGHSSDVYVRLPKLGTKKERIEEIVL